MYNGLYLVTKGHGWGEYICPRRDFDGFRRIHEYLLSRYDKSFCTLAILSISIDRAFQFLPCFKSGMTMGVLISTEEGKLKELPC
jgi:hypothetical protein